MRATQILLTLLMTLLLCSRQLEATGSVYGIGFSPYVSGQDPNLGAEVTPSQILQRLQIVAPHTTWIRSFGMTHGLENIPLAARQLGLKVAATAWISGDTAQNAIEISNLVAAANAGLVDIAIVGSEAILRNDLPESQLIAYMNQVRQSIPSGIPVTTADVYGVLLAHPNLIAASDVVFANFYPYWEGTSINNAMCTLQQEYQQVVAAAGSRPVVVSETGWPSAGNAVGAAIPSLVNAATFARRFFTWAGAHGVASFYFEGFDEAWKEGYEGPQGAHWGIWDEAGSIKPGMDAFFNGATETVDCNGPIPGPVGLRFVYVPPFGSSDALEAQVTGVRPSDYAIATYIFVNGGWWTKPTFAQPTVAIKSDGTAQIPIVTGGSDQLATRIAAFLIPAGVTPPAASGGGLPDVAGSVATMQITRTESSISGRLLDRQNLPIVGGTVTDPVLGSAVSAPDGKYSFYSIATGGSAVLTVSHPDYVFVGSPVTVDILAGNQVVNLRGSAIVDLSIASSVSPNPAFAGANVTQTLTVSNGGPVTASDGHLSVSLPDSFQVVSVTGSRGACTATVPVACEMGPLPPGASFMVTVVLHPANAGVFSVSATVAGPDLDPEVTNNSTSASVTVNPPPVITADAVSPNAGTGASQTFTLQYGDTAGATNLDSAWMWINASLASSAANSCLTYYSVPTNTLFLLNDTGATWLSGTVGGNGSLQNSQCAIALGGSAATPAGTTLTLRLPVTFAAGFSGAKNVYVYAANAAGTNSGWQMRGTWTVAVGAGAVITADSVTPGTGSGGSQTFTLQYGDTAGATDLEQAWVWINASFSASAANSCLSYYSAPANTFYLLNDSATTWLSGAVGSGGSLQNSQCAIALGGSTVAKAGEKLTLHVPMTFAAGFSGAKNVYMFARNAAGTNSAWQTRGTWTVATAPPPGAVVTAESVSPSAGSGGSQTFTLQYGDTAGASDLDVAWVWIKAALATSAADSCLAYYKVATNTLYLLNDSATTWLSGTAGNVGSLQNSQCTIALSSSTATKTGEKLTLQVPMTFASGFSGAKNVDLFAANASGINSGWQTRGTWTVATAPPPGAVVTAESVSPSAGSGGSQTFTLQYGDTAGASDLDVAWVWIKAALATSAADSCLAYYKVATNTLYLLNDSATTWLSGTVGSVGSLQNSQCAIALGSSTATKTGEKVTLQVPITFASGFSGAKNVDLFAANASGINSGWQTRGTWTVATAPPPGAVVTAESVSPNAGTGGSQTFTLSYGDTVGATDLDQAWLWINASFAASAANSCLSYVSVPTNTLYLLNDSATTWLSGVLGSSGSLGNSQCAIALDSGTVTKAGTTLSLQLSVTFASGFNGAKTVYLYARNASGSSSGWQTRGTWTVAANAP